MILDAISNQDRYYSLHPGVEAALHWLAGQGMTRLAQLEPGKHDSLTGHPGTFGIVQRYATRAPAEVVWESHRAYIDVQVMLDGAERVGWRNLDESLPIKSAYDAERDAAFYDLPDDGSGFAFRAGEFAVFWPSDVHAPNLRIAVTGEAQTVTKLVLKVPV